MCVPVEKSKMTKYLEDEMAKTIVLKYQGKCADCGAILPIGSKARWYGRGRVYGIGCHEKAEYTTSNGRKPSVSYITTSGGTFASCNCEDYPCCGH